MNNIKGIIRRTHIGKTAKISFLFASFIFLTAMGIMGDGPKGEVPMPEVNYTVNVTDKQEIKTKCANTAFESDTFFIGTRGEGTVTIPFDKVSKVKFVKEVKGGKADFQITLNSGEKVAITFDIDARITGTTSFGTFRLNAGNLKEMDFKVE